MPLTRLVLLGLSSLFGLRALRAPIGFPVLSSQERWVSIASVATVGVLGTPMLAAAFSTAVTVRAVRAGLPRWQSALVQLAAVVLHSAVGLYIAVSYSL